MVILRPYEEIGGDGAGNLIERALRADYALAAARFEGFGPWFYRTCYDAHLLGAAASIAKHQQEWRDELERAGGKAVAWPAAAARPLVDLPRLVPRGQVFALETGERFTVIEASDFHLFGRFCAGEDLTAVLEQRHRYGFNCVRVFTLYELEAAGIGRLNPCPYGKLRAFCKLLDSYGLYAQFVAFTSTYAPAHWERLCEALAGATNVLVSLVNENDQPQNRIDTNAYGRPDYLLCSHGSNGADADTVKPIWDYGEYHTNDLNQWWRKVGHNAMELSSGPMLATENTRFPDRDASVTHAFDAAAGAALLCAGACFHSVSGKASQLWTGQEAQCALAWAAGAKSVPLEAQAGQYAHRIDLEDEATLRVYQRILPSGERYTVRIRK